MVSELWKARGSFFAVFSIPIIYLVVVSHTSLPTFIVKSPEPSHCLQNTTGIFFPTTLFPRQSQHLPRTPPQGALLPNLSSSDLTADNEALTGHNAQLSSPAIKPTRQQMRGTWAYIQPPDFHTSITNRWSNFVCGYFLYSKPADPSFLDFFYWCLLFFYLQWLILSVNHSFYSIRPS